MMLGACAGPTGSDGNEDSVCKQQAEWARSGKVDGRDIFISCPGSSQTGAAQPVYENEYNRNAGIYRAGFEGALAVATAR